MFIDLFNFRKLITFFTKFFFEFVHLASLKIPGDAKNVSWKAMTLPPGCGPVSVLSCCTIEAVVCIGTCNFINHCHRTFAVRKRAFRSTIFCSVFLSKIFDRSND